MFFGRAYWRIHRYIDKPVRWAGKNHRRYFHDAASAYAIARKLYPNDAHAVDAAYLHILLDILCTENKELKHILQQHAYYDIARRKKERLEKGKKASHRLSKQRDRFFSRFPELQQAKNEIERRKMPLDNSYPSYINFVDVIIRNPFRKRHPKLIVEWI